jgi:hypothetical protein
VRRLIAALLLFAFAAGAAAWRLADVKPDPNVQAIADGCQRDTTKIFTGFAPNWVYVNDRDFPSSGPPPPPRTATGVVKGASGLLAARISSSDDPITHRSVDVNVDLTVDKQNDFLTGVSRDGTPEQGTLHLERETDSYPQWTIPQAGDRVLATGSWIWDCDHFQGKGEKTELHPFRTTWVLRHPERAAPTSKLGWAEGDLYMTTDATPAGQEAECAHRTKGSADFKACTHSIGNTLGIDGAYEFALCAPQPAPKGAHLVWRIVDRGSVNAPKVPLFPGNLGCASLRFTVAAPAAARVVVAKQVYLGWSRPARVDHLRLHFDRLLVRRAMDPSCPPDKPDCPFANESTLPGQIAQSPGEWQLDWSVDGIWGRWPGTLAAKDDSTFRGRQSVDFYLPHGGTWTFVVLARECDLGAIPSFAGVGHAMQPCPTSGEVGNAKGDDYPGAITVTFRGAALGRHVTDASTAGSTCPVSNLHGCYQLTYSVSRVR